MHFINVLDEVIDKVFVDEDETFVLCCRF